jgi:hypothetical protein
MTPAKLWALEHQRMNTIGLLTFPVDKFAWMYFNANRDAGETDANGRVIRPPADPLDIEEFRTYGRKLKTLAAKDAWDASLLGAKASKAAFQAWGRQGVGEIFVPTPRKDN